MKMYAKVVGAVIMVAIMGMVADADGLFQQEQWNVVDSNVVNMPPAHSSPLFWSDFLPSSQVQRQGQETLSTMEPSTSAAVMMDPPVDGQEAADTVDAADVVMADPPVTNSSNIDTDTDTDSTVWNESTSQGPVSSGNVDVVVPVQGDYDYTNYQGLLNSRWPAMTETCVSGKHKFDPLTQKRVYRVGTFAPAGIEMAWREYNITFTTYLNAVVGPRFDPPIQFEMEVTTRPLNHWVSEIAADHLMIVLAWTCKARWNSLQKMLLPPSFPLTHTHT
jgi:hypothetical protein